MQDVILASDHRGFDLKQRIKDYLREKKIMTVDVGTTNGTTNVDFPVYVKEACECVLGARHFCGIFVCGSGIGVTIAANRFKGIRAVLAHSVEEACAARQHNDVNVLCLSGEQFRAGGEGDFEDIKKIITAFLNTKFLGEEKYRRRNALLDA
jgi:ribose 5-phosphate isomerase B